MLNLLSMHRREDLLLVEKRAETTMLKDCMEYADITQVIDYFV